MKPGYKEALYWHSVTNGIKCKLCPHECLIKTGNHGICKTRININNVLFTKAFGNICSASIDPIEKKPLFHFLPSSKTFSFAIEGCTFHCLNCQNFSISQKEPEEISKYNFTPSEIVKFAIKNNCTSISFTYSEPVVFYEFMLETAKQAKQSGIRTVMVSNGYINKLPLEELSQFIDAANIDLKCFDENIYKKLTGGKLSAVLETIKTLKEKGVWLEITNLIIPEWTDNIGSIKEMCKWLFKNNLSEVPLHFSRFYPTFKLINLPPTNTDILLKAVDIAKQEGLKYVYLGNIMNNDNEDTHCYSCNKSLVKRNYFTITENLIENGKCIYCDNLISGIWE
ncbi:MAG: AmmeMemoRadiSam system radical SAM enzyme [Bacteroidia bacterium]|nr:AmmeMemoRadiSam system radical SAM enzyme [Bacteroidia bacterium]